MMDDYLTRTRDSYSEREWTMQSPKVQERVMQNTQAVLDELNNWLYNNNETSCDCDTHPPFNL